MTSTVRTVVGLATLYGLLLLYLAPSLLAARRNAPVTAVLLRRNVYLGWTVVGWLACLVVALRQPRRATTIPHSHGPVRHDEMPTWVTDLPPQRGPWRALPRDTGPIDPRWQP